MKKILLTTLLIMGVSMYGWSSAEKIVINKHGKEIVQGLKKIKTWNCWNISSSDGCLSGFFCGYNQAQAVSAFVAIYNANCSNTPPCEP